MEMGKGVEMGTSVIVSATTKIQTVSPACHLGTKLREFRYIFYKNKVLFSPNHALCY